MKTFNPCVSNDFLYKDEINEILSFAKAFPKWQNEWKNAGSDYWSGRVLDASSIYDTNKELGITLYLIRNRVKKKIKEYFNLDQNVYPDTFQLVRWPSGLEQPPHTDDMKIYPGGDVHHHRNFGSVIYLNDDFTGGHTYYPKHSFEVKPKPGTLVVHPADENYLHGVSKVAGSTRYTLSSFWTYNEDKFDNWVLPQIDLKQYPC